jgi:cation transport ATPase
MASKAIMFLGICRGPLKRFFSQFHNVLIYVLLVAAGVTAAIDHWTDSGVIVGVVLINALIGFIQEGKAEKSLDAIRNMLTSQAMVRRESKAFLLPAEQLVPGDIVSLESGDKVPADLRLLKVKNLRVDESMLTGESIPAEKTTAAVNVNAALGDRCCLAYSGTLITYGTALGMVVASGDKTEIGHISSPVEQGLGNDHAAASANCRFQPMVDRCYIDPGLCHLRLWLVYPTLLVDKVIRVSGEPCRGSYPRRVAGHYDHHPGYRCATYGQA